MNRVTEFDWLNRTAVRKILPVHPRAHEQSDDNHKHKHGWLLRGLERLENRDGQFSPLLLGQEFARKLHKLQIQSRRHRQFFFSAVPAAGISGRGSSTRTTLLELAPRR